ncbi:hypothetical protein DFH06DRAFT_1145369 [Mycena polygramma]|nr:hypothetical protein DFH06DRAFT_1145369 [Mycena polygramma]
MRSERQENNKFGIHEYIRHIKARFVKKPEHRGKVAPGMQDLAQEVSTKRAKVTDVLQHHGGGPHDGGRFDSRRGGEGSTLERIPLRQSYPRDAGVPVVPWASSPTVRGSAWGGFEDAMTKWSYTERRLPTVSTCDTIGRTPVRPDRERAPVWVTDWRMGRWQGLEGASVSITGVESSVEVCEWTSGGYGKRRRPRYWHFYATTEPSDQTRLNSGCFKVESSTFNTSESREGSIVAPGNFAPAFSETGNFPLRRVPILSSQVRLCAYNGFGYGGPQAPFRTQTRKKEGQAFNFNP